MIFLFPLWGILHPPAYTLANLLPFTALGWLCLGAIAAASSGPGPASFERWPYSCQPKRKPAPVRMQVQVGRPQAPSAT